MHAKTGRGLFWLFLATALANLTILTIVLGTEYGKAADWCGMGLLFTCSLSAILCAVVAKDYRRIWVGYALFGFIVPFITPFVLLSAIRQEQRARVLAASRASAAVSAQRAHQTASAPEAALGGEAAGGLLPFHVPGRLRVSAADCPECGGKVLLIPTNAEMQWIRKRRKGQAIVTAIALLCLASVLGPYCVAPLAPLVSSVLLALLVSLEARHFLGWFNRVPYSVCQGCGQIVFPERVNLILDVRIPRRFIRQLRSARKDWVRNARLTTKRCLLDLAQSDRNSRLLALERLSDLGFEAREAIPTLEQMADKQGDEVMRQSAQRCLGIIRGAQLSGDNTPS